MKKNFIEDKNLGGFITFYLPCVIKHCKDTLNAINLQPSYKKHWLSFPFSLVL